MRHGIHGIVFLASILVVTGCAHVDPGPEYADARRLIVETTGVETVYDPDEEAMDEARIEALLQDGLSLDEALRLALVNNRRLQAGFMEIGVSTADWVQSGLFTNPSVGLALRYPDGGGGSNIQATLVQNIVDLWQIPVRREAARNTLDETILRIARHAGLLSAETKAAYFAAVAAEHRLENATEQSEVHDQYFRAVANQREAGAASLMDESLARARSNASSLAVRNARLEVAISKGRLARLLSLSRDMGEIELTDDLPAIEQEPLHANELIALARESRLDLRALATALRAAAARAEFEKRSVLPDLSLGPDYERSSVGPDTETLVGAALSMTLPLWDQNQAQAARAEYEFVRTARLYDALSRELAQEIRAAVQSAATAAENLEFHDAELLPRAERFVELSTASHKVGETDLLALLDARSTLLDARAGHVNAREEAATALAALESAVGAPLDRMRNNPYALDLPVTRKESE